MNFDVLTADIKVGIENISIDKLYEIRLRKGFPALLKFSDKNKYLGINGAIESKEKAIIITDKHINEIIDNVTEHSLYAFNECLKRGFLTSKNGLRIGVAGECVVDNGQVLTIKNVASLNIRIPHKIKNCSNKIYKHVISDKKIFNTLIVSAPGFGKTTILKDLAEKISEENLGAVLIVDEREEFIDVIGENIDCLRNCDKSYAFDCGIRVMSPKVIVTDELSSIYDWQCAKNAINSGVKVFASCHADNIEQLVNKNEFKKDVFDRYVLLRGDGEAGVVKGVYDGDFRLL